MNVRATSPVLVTGGAGFVGSHVVDALLARGSDVRVLVRPTTSLAWLDRSRVTLVHGDVGDTGPNAEDALARAAEGTALVIHAAGITHAKQPDDFARVNAGGTDRMARAAVRAGVPRLLYVSSQAAAGPTPGETPRVETDPEVPVGAYGLSKLEGERCAAAAAEASGGRLEVVTVRPPAVYGPRDHAFLALFKLVQCGIVPLHAPDRQTLSLVHARDLAEGIALAAARGSAGARYYLTDGTPVTSARVVDAMAAALGKKPLRVHVPAGMLKALVGAAEGLASLTGRTSRLTRERLADWLAPRWTLSDAKARAELGYRPAIALDEGVAETVAWYRSAGWI